MSKNKILKIILIVLASLCIVVFTLLLLLPHSSKKENTAVKKKEVVVTNPVERDIAVFGINNKDLNENGLGLSDAIMIVHVNTSEKSIKVTSILRDTKAEIPGYYSRKINSAFALGGPELALAAINKNFDFNIEDYVTINFDGLTAAIDAIGGVELNISDDEAWCINEGLGSSLTGGPQTLTGSQALEFSRIRKLDSDYYRAGRQQLVLGAVVKKIENSNVLALINMFTTLFKHVETSLSLPEILAYINSDAIHYSLSFVTVPDFGNGYSIWGGIDDNGEWVYLYDTHAAGVSIKNFFNNTNIEVAPDPEIENKIQYNYAKDNSGVPANIGELKNSTEEETENATEENTPAEETQHESQPEEQVEEVSPSIEIVPED